MKHRERHPVDVDGCFGCKVMSVSVAASATPTRSPGAARAAEVNATERRWDKDLPAFARLRQQGLQPQRVDGAADVEARATERHHVEGGPDPKVVERVLNR